MCIRDRDTGITCYPLSSNMQRPQAAVHLVAEAEKPQDPGLYIFELRMYLGPDERLTQNMAYTRPSFRISVRDSRYT